MTGKMPACRVTHSRKRYRCGRVFVCLGCDGLATSARSHAITCSPACRVRVHRHPEKLRFLEAEARKIKVTVPFMLDMEAALLLLPDVEPAIALGEVELNDLRVEIWREYWRQLRATRPDA